jgi:hypothetical protein
MAASLEQLVRNQMLLREVNDRIAEIVSADGDAPAEFVCECSNDDCAETLPLSLLAYKGIRSSANLFVVLRDHEIPEVDRVVEEHERFNLVEKTQHVDLVVDAHRDSLRPERG